MYKVYKVLSRPVAVTYSTSHWMVPVNPDDAWMSLRSFLAGLFPQPDTVRKGKGSVVFTAASLVLMKTLNVFRHCEVKSSQPHHGTDNLCDGSGEGR